MAQKPLYDIPIVEIRVVNPRTRSRKQFQVVVKSIASVGLKKPITVAKRPPSEDGTRYDLVVGQGRMEAFLALGHTSIPANVIEATTEDLLIMSLIENIARRSPSNKTLYQEVSSLTAKGYGPREIALKLGYDESYIGAIRHLIEKDEADLCEAVEANRIPLSIALAIANEQEPDVQRALSEAYESGELRGRRFIEAQRMLADHSFQRHDGAVPEARPALSGKDLVKEYERRTREQQNLAARSSLVHDKLVLLRSAMRSLLADQDLITLLRAESLQDVPAGLAIDEGGSDD